MRQHLGKFLVALALAPALCMADEVGGSENANGFFVGLDLGATSSFESAKPTGGGTERKVGQTPTFMNVGIKLGYNYYFMDFLGARAYLDYSYGFNTADGKSGSTTASTLTTLNSVALNIDLLANLYKTDSIAFGAFVGIGLGYATWGQTLKNVPDTQGGTLSGSSAVADGFILPINVGLSLTANNHHRFEFGVKIPTLGLTPALKTQGVEQSTRTMITTMGYSYIF